MIFLLNVEFHCYVRKYQSVPFSKTLIFVASLLNFTMFMCPPGMVGWLAYVGKLNIFPMVTRWAPRPVINGVITPING